MTPRKPLFAIVVALAMTLAACGGSSTLVTGEDPEPTPAPTVEPTIVPPTPTPGGPELDAVKAARVRWESAAISDYAYTLQQRCECDDETSGPWRVRVTDGEVVATIYFGTPSTVAGHSVEELFAMIEASIGDGVEVDVTYDEITGFPGSVRLDVAALAVDGGLDLQTSDLYGYDTIRRDLADARARGEASGVRHYELTYQDICFCPAVLVSIVVEDGVIIERDVEGPGFDSPSWTVEDMFDLIAGALDRGAFRIDATYDPELGYPVDFFIDDVEMMADEEFGVSVTEFMIR